jgi:hypothetical protein
MSLASHLPRFSPHCAVLRFLRSGPLPLFITVRSLFSWKPYLLSAITATAMPKDRAYEPLQLELPELTLSR